MALWSQVDQSLQAMALNKALVEKILPASVETPAGTVPMPIQQCAAIASGQQYQALSLRPIAFEWQATQRGVEVAGQHRALPYRIHPAFACTGQAGAVAHGKNRWVGVALQRGGDQDKALLIAAQATVRRPGKGFGAAGQQQPLTAPDGFVAAEQAVVLDAVDRAILAHPHAALAQMAEGAQTHASG